MFKGSTQLKEKKQINCFQSDKDATIKLNKKIFKKKPLITNVSLLHTKMHILILLKVHIL